jgi:cytochrome c551/c552
MRFTKFIGAGVSLGVLIGLGPVAAMAADGKALLTEYKCTTCHSVKNVGVEKTKKKKGPDLSGVGLDHDAAWFQKWLNKEVETKSAYSDKQVKHKKKWKGSDEDLKTITTFLAAQKTKVAVKDEGGDDDSGDE